VSDEPAPLDGRRSPVDAADLPRLGSAVLVDHPRRAWVEQIMGMPISIHLRSPDIRLPALTPVAEAAVSSAFAGLRRVDAVFSTWSADSQVSRLRRGELTLADCDPEVGEVAGLCREARDRTQGWFDAELPDADGVRRFEPTGLVKGWAVERACTALAAALPDVDVLVNAGGDVAVATGRTDTPPWSIGIENPLDRTTVLAGVPISSGGVATSGTAARGAHILVPATGLPATELASVSVIGPSLMWADVYATAAFARGTDAVAWLRTLTHHTWLVVARDGTVTTPHTQVS
jgi:thiamine biosynthesis lipoprotein